MTFIVYDDPEGFQEVFATSHRAAQAWGDTARGLAAVRAGLRLMREGLELAQACPEEEGQDQLGEQLVQVERQLEQVEQQIEAARAHQHACARASREAQRRLAAVVDATLAA